MLTLSLSSIGYNSIENSILVLTNDSFGTDGRHLSHFLRLLKGRRTSVSSNGGAITLGINEDILYSAPKDFDGVDTFKYTITDGSGDASTGTVTLTVSGPVVSVPTANIDSFTADVDTALSLDVLANDLIPAGGVTISLPLSVTSAQGFAISVVNNEVLYTPSNGYNGSDTFSYSITDVNTVTSTAVVTIMVGTVPVPPVGSD
ncbi:Ig-like domain-containing protein, partial [Polaribacter glomeratus]